VKPASQLLLKIIPATMLDYGVMARRLQGAMRHWESEKK
jgi:hypothetical protein